MGNCCPCSEKTKDDGNTNNVSESPERVILPKPQILVAVYDYQAKSDEETVLSFRNGDRMQLLDDSNSEWCLVVDLNTKAQGYVPSSYVAPESSIETKAWFFPNTTRKEAELLLLSKDNERGAFLIRPSECVPHCLSLSIKDWLTTGYEIKHYKIKYEDSMGYYISKDKPFHSLTNLVNTYSKNSLGLCYVLKKPCQKVEPTTWDLAPAFRDKWEMPRYDIKLHEELGRGCFGKVFRGTWKNVVEVAVKTLREGNMSKSAFLEEAKIMKGFRHKNIIKLYGICSQEDPIYIVQEYMSKGSLLQLLRNDKVTPLKFEILIYIALQVACGMEYLESKQLIHRDLAARNVLIGENNSAKICDFGLARVLENNEYSASAESKSKLPVKWTAPEALLFKKYTIKSDVWSYGIFLMELFTYGRVPYPGLDCDKVLPELEKGNRMPRPDIIPQEVYDNVILKCWDFQAETRPTFTFLAQYFKEYSVSSEAPYKETDDPYKEIEENT